LFYLQYIKLQQSGLITILFAKIINGYTLFRFVILRSWILAPLVSNGELEFRFRCQPGDSQAMYTFFEVEFPVVYVKNSTNKVAKKRSWLPPCNQKVIPGVLAG
jgi:hypothetical protein